MLHTFYRSTLVRNMLLVTPPQLMSNLLTVRTSCLSSLRGEAEGVSWLLFVDVVVELLTGGVPLGVEDVYHWLPLAPTSLCDMQCLWYIVLVRLRATRHCVFTG